MFIALQLLALAVGYKIFADATKESKKELHSLGRIIGLVIMVISISAVVFKIGLMCPYKSTCPVSAMMCSMKK